MTQTPTTAPPLTSQPPASFTHPRPAAATVINDAGAIDRQTIDRLHTALNSHPTATLMQNAVTKTSIDDIALNRRVITGTQHTFSHKLDDWEVTNQQKSGRCWMFAGLNLLRVGAMKKMNLKEFEFSQNYTYFWDKFERANYFLEAIIETAALPADDRRVAFLLDRPLEDGGQWNMFVNVIRKYGLVPKSVMPESESSSNTPRMNANIISKLREAAHMLRSLRSSGAPLEAVRSAKQDVLATIFRMLSIHLGTPPRSFDWQWNDKDKQFHRDGAMTPLEFAAKYITLPIDDYVCLVHDPRETSPFNRTFTVEFLGNVLGGEIVKYLNIDIALMKDLARQLIESGEPVWFGCDVGKQMRRDLGLWDNALMEYNRVYDTAFSLNKAQRLVHHDTLMTHAMLFTGVDVVGSNGTTTRRWRVENSWGDESGLKGYYTMNDSWFDENVFEIAAPKSLLSDELRQALNSEPIVLSAWDPMGSLA